MFCNKERIKISSFFLFSSPKMGKTDCWLPTEALAGDVVGCPLSLPENVGMFFCFLYKIKKNFVQKIFGTRQAFRSCSLCMRKMLKKLRQSSAYFQERRIFVK